MVAESPPLVGIIEAECREIASEASERRGQLRRLGKYGKPNKLTFRRLRAILRAVMAGTPKTVAAEAHGIRAATLCDWRETYPKLSTLLMRCENLGCISLVQSVRGGEMINGKPDWKAAGWLLERRHKEHFAAPKSSETNVNVTNNSLSLNLSANQLATLSAAHSAAVAGLALPPPNR